jgi:large subunit ribosomal protein L2
MAIRKTKPTSPGRRFATYQLREELTTDRPNKKLTKGKSSTGGRNTHGRVTSRHRGGGAKRRYRQIDFKRQKDGVPAKVATIEYDPNRTTYIALLHYADGAKSYILAPQGLGPGDTVESGEHADIRPGNALPLRSIPTGTIVHNVELTPGQGGRMGRAAGSAIQVAAREGAMVTLRLPSSEMRLVRGDCRATVGTLANAEHQNVTVGKAGRSRHKGVRPQTRGVAMNPVDHPHGGGEAHKTPGGHPRTPWGKPTLGYRTRKKGKRSSAMIVRGRRRGKRKGGNR